MQKVDIKLPLIFTEYIQFVRAPRKRVIGRINVLERIKSIYYIRKQGEAWSKRFMHTNREIG